ncbi:unnamed protein product [Owenia fusiformis]|uniref:Uncharacterized protein n=1 Tax=Owenia fusiformis TaxID=6347 RepID=A0A8J1Y434_OWEFU|nr:unnamed protein product [Owenia fusiformis]
MSKTTVQTTTTDEIITVPTSTSTVQTTETDQTKTAVQTTTIEEITTTVPTSTTIVQTTTTDENTSAVQITKTDGISTILPTTTSDKTSTTVPATTSDQTIVTVPMTTITNTTFASSTVITTAKMVTKTEPYSCGKMTCPPGRVGKTCAESGYAFSVVLRLNERFSEALKDVESEEYKDFKEKFFCSVSEGYKQGILGHKYRAFLKIENLTSGSILVAFSLTLEPLSIDGASDPPTPDLVEASFNVTAANQFGLLKYRGQPESVKDYDECSTHSSNDCHANASCTNQIGSYTCACATGFVDERTDTILPGRMCKAEYVLSRLDYILIIVGGFVAVGLISVIVTVCCYVRNMASKRKEINRTYPGL